VLFVLLGLLYSEVVIQIIFSISADVACMEEMKNTYRILVRKPKEKRPIGKCRYRWKDSIKMYLKETGC
jgi:hypothetical protein